MPFNRISLAGSALLLLAALPLVTAHGDEHEHSGMAMDMGSVHINMTSAATGETPSVVPHNYFRYPGFAGWMYAHIVLMTIAWAVVLPVGENQGSVVKNSSMLTRMQPLSLVWLDPDSRSRCYSHSWLLTESVYSPASSTMRKHRTSTQATHIIRWDGPCPGLPQHGS